MLLRLDATHARQTVGSVYPFDDDDDDNDDDGDDETGGFVVSLLIGRRGNDRLNLSSPVSVPSVSAVENSGACDT